MANQRVVISARFARWATRQSAFEFALPILIYGFLLVWVLVNPIPSNRSTPPGALLILITISLLTAGGMRVLRVRSGIDMRAALALPDPLYMLDLAVVILVGTRPAVVVSLLAALLATLPDSPSSPSQWITTLRQSAAAGATTLLAALSYHATAQLLSVPMHAVHARVVGALVASVAMLVGVAVVRALEGQQQLVPLLSRQWTFLINPAIRFQSLMLAIGPLLPLVESLDGAEAEVAWVLFLVPLYAIYYLALVSTRLEQRQIELRRTIEELRISRRREAELTDYAALITQAQEEERRRLARELHDDTAQALVALARGLDTLSAQTSGSRRPAQDARFVDDLSDLAKRSLESIRRACQDLRPPVLDDLGISPALASLASATSQRGLACDFTSDGDGCLCPPEVEMTVYRIAQEALSNALRHAEAQHADIELTYSPQLLQLVIRDDGHGFWPTAPLPHHASTLAETRSGLGLLGMRERASLIGAHLRIESAPARGTAVILRVPLPRNAEE